MSSNAKYTSDYTHIKVTVENAAITIPAVLRLIIDLAEFEKARDQVQATEELLYQNILGIQKPSSVGAGVMQMEKTRQYAECILIYKGGLQGEAVGLACYFYTFSTWTGKGGIYLEDLYVSPAHRSLGLARSLFKALAVIADTSDLARIDWSVLDWNVGAKGVYTAMGATLKSEWEGMRLEGKALKDLLQ